jgi:transposase
MRLVTIDLGKFKSVACLYLGEEDVTFRTIETRPQSIHDLLVAWTPDRLVIEVGTVSGWVYDVARALGIDVQVANPNTEGWRWRRVKRKTDRDDALKLARLSATGQLPTVWMPAPRVRQWRSLIHYRHALVSRRTAILCSIRSLLDMQGYRMAMGPKAWTEKGVESLRAMAQPAMDCGPDELWRGQLDVELTLLQQLQTQIRLIEAKLDDLAEADARTKRLRTIPGVGPRLSEAVVAWIDDPHRFRDARSVGSYVGLVPTIGHVRPFGTGDQARPEPAAEVTGGGGVDDAATQPARGGVVRQAEQGGAYETQASHGGVGPTTTDLVLGDAEGRAGLGRSASGPGGIDRGHLDNEQDNSAAERRL